MDLDVRLHRAVRQSDWGYWGDGTRVAAGATLRGLLLTLKVSTLELTGALARLEATGQVVRHHPLKSPFSVRYFTDQEARRAYRD